MLEAGLSILFVSFLLGSVVFYYVFSRRKTWQVNHHNINNNRHKFGPESKRLAAADTAVNGAAATSGIETFGSMAMAAWQTKPERLVEHEEQKNELYVSAPNMKNSSLTYPDTKYVKDLRNPIYRAISRKNGEINRLSEEQMQDMLSTLGLNTGGISEILRTRLKSYYRDYLMKQAGLEMPSTYHNYDYLCVIDFEATCEEPTPVEYVQEIIEFPVVLVNTVTMKVEDQFNMFIKPLLNPKLSPFCKELTSITQRQVDRADTFPLVMSRVHEWMKSKKLGTEHSFIIVTDGPWDMNMYLNVQCKLSRVPYPAYARQWVNLCKTFSNFYKTKRMCLRNMLGALGMGFDGRPHRGIDDALNIANIAIQLMKDGCELEVNDRLTQ